MCMDPQQVLDTKKDSKKYFTNEGKQKKSSLYFQIKNVRGHFLLGTEAVWV